jgi:hypothetical protein
MPWAAIAAIIAATSAAYTISTAERQRKEASNAAKSAQKESEIAQLKANEMAERQLAAQREQTQISRERMNFELEQAAGTKATLAEQSKAAQEKAAAMSADIEAQQRKAAETESSRMKAARRGGQRSLLSSARLTPEMGLGNYNASTFGSSVSV